MDTELLALGTELMLIGMGIVFVFLTLLVGATVLMSRTVMRFDKSVAVVDKDEEIAAAVAAVELHRRKR